MVFVTVVRAKSMVNWTGRHVVVRRLFAGALTGLAIALCLVLPTAAARQSSEPMGRPTPQLPDSRSGIRLYIAAARDSRLFTLCPPPGWPPPAPWGKPQPIVDGVTLYRVQSGTWDVQVARVWYTGERAELPPPQSLAGTLDGPPERVELDRDLLAWDDEIAAAIASEVSKRNEFRIVESVDRADDVLLVEGQHQTVASFSGRDGTAEGMISQIGGDREANFRWALFGVLVPAEAYRTHGPNVTALLSVSRWNGMALARNNRHSIAEDNGHGGVTLRPSPPPPPGDLSRLDPASVEWLVQQVHDRTKRPRGFPPLCAASNQRSGTEATTFRRVDEISSVGLTRPLRSADGAMATPTFSSGVTYVSVPVVVKDTNGRPVQGLSDAEFRVYEDDTAQKIDRLLPMSAAVDLALVVDTSSSMRFERSGLLTAILAFIETLRGDDRVMVSSFDDRLFVQAELTSDHARLKRAVSQLGRGQGTRLFDAIALLAARRVPGMGDRKAMVLLTDGVDTRSRLANAGSTLAPISDSQVPVYVIQYDTRRNDYTLPFGAKSGGMTIREMVPLVMPEGGQDNRELFMRADTYLGALTELSGGRLYRAETLGNLNKAFAQIARELGEQFTLGYYPANQARDGTYRRLRVEVNRADVQVQARAGYRAPLGPSGVR